MNTALKHLIDNYNYKSSDQYLLNEYHNGFFKRENIVENYKANAEKLIKPLGNMFPGYFEK